MATRVYYKKKVEELEMYQRLIQYWSVMFDPSLKAIPMDHMNFNADVFPPALTLTEIEQITKFEPGYASPDGVVELGPLIRELELTRLNYVDPKNKKKNKKLVEQAGLGAAHGCTNVMSGLLNSIPKLSKEIFPRQSKQPEVILTLPNYTVYLAQISNMSGLVKPRFIRAKRETNFLPTFEQIKKIVNKKTAAIVVTYPNNPAQSTYEGDATKELKKIVKFCQKEGIFLIVDNIYQDELFPQGRKHTEVFSLTNKLNYIIKVFGPSKDTTFFSGYRCGYWFGDPRIENTYQYYISATENTLSTVSMLMFAWDMLFRARRLVKKPVTLADMELLNTGLFGWGREFDAKKIYANLKKMKLFEKYSRRIDKADIKMEKTNKKIATFVEKSKYFSDYVNQSIGNVFFIRVNPDYYKGDDDQFFHDLIRKGGYAVLPGNVFGVPRKKGNVWFRITLIHDTCDNIIKGLKGIEKFLQNKK
jgi:aspartate/methionine/tyrosine aminotransferase